MLVTHFMSFLSFSVKNSLKDIFNRFFTKVNVNDEKELYFYFIHQSHTK